MQSWLGRLLPHRWRWPSGLRASDLSDLSPRCFHSKANSLDTSVPTAPAPQQDCSSLAPVMNESRPVIHERHRVVISCPPQSEAELELKEEDTVVFHKNESMVVQRHITKNWIDQPFSGELCVKYMRRFHVKKGPH